MATDRKRTGYRVITRAMAVAMAALLAGPPSSAPVPCACVAPAFAQPAALRLDLATVSRVMVHHPTLLEQDGYGATYIIEVPAQQFVTFLRASPSSEFEQIQVEIDRGTVTEVRTSKAGEPSGLVIRFGQSGLVAYWDLPALARIPPPPPEAEVRRRFELATGLLAKAQGALGLKDFSSGESGTIEIRLAGVEDLSLASRGAEVLQTYTFFSLGKENMVEELVAESPGVTFSISVEADRVVVQRSSQEPGGPEVVLELTLEGGTWQASRETRRSGGRSVIEDLPRPEAERLLTEGLRHLRSAREFFRIDFGRNITGIGLP